MTLGQVAVAGIDMARVIEQTACNLKYLIVTGMIINCVSVGQVLSVQPEFKKLGRALS